MFDYIQVDIPLTLPQKHQEEFKDVKWEDEEFITTSICPPALDRFSFSTNKKIYKEKVEYKEDEYGDLTGIKYGRIEEVNHTGEIVFSSKIPRKDEDVTLTFRAFFYKGMLQEVEFVDLVRESNKARVEAEERIKKKMEEGEIMRKKWWFDSYGTYLILTDYLFFIVRYCLSVLIKLSFYIQRKIT